MSTRFDLRKPTVPPKAVPNLRRTPRPVHPPRWLLPAAIGLFTVVVVVLGINLLRSGDDTTTAFEPLIVPEEQAFIDAHIAEVPRTPAVRSSAVTLHPRPTGIAGMIGHYESEYILNRVPQALLPSPASVGFPRYVGEYEQAFVQDHVPMALMPSLAPAGFPQLVDEYEQAFIDAHIAELPRAAVASRVPISERPTGIAGMIGYYESEYILDRVPLALLPSPASVGFPQLMGSEEQAFAHGDYAHPWAGQLWCDTHRPC